MCSNCKSSLYVLLPDYRGFFYSEWRRKLNFCDVFLWVVVKLRNFVSCVSGREIFKHCFWVWSYTYGALHEDKGLFLVALVSKNSFSLYFCQFFAVFVKFSFFKFMSKFSLFDDVHLKKNVTFFWKYCCIIRGFYSNFLWSPIFCFFKVSFQRES